MTDLAKLRADFESAHQSFKDLLNARFPSADKYTWYRALAHINGEIGRWNDSTNRDADLAADKDIQAAHDEYIRLLHMFYRARDGERGVLGGRL